MPRPGLAPPVSPVPGLHSSSGHTDHVCWTSSHCQKGGHCTGQGQGAQGGQRQMAPGNHKMVCVGTLLTLFILTLIHPMSLFPLCR